MWNLGVNEPDDSHGVSPPKTPRAPSSLSSVLVENTSFARTTQKTELLTHLELLGPAVLDHLPLELGQQGGRIGRERAVDMRLELDRFCGSRQRKVGHTRNTAHA